MHAHACPSSLSPLWGSPTSKDTILDLSQQLIFTRRGFDGAASVLHMVAVYRTTDQVKEVPSRQGLVVDDLDVYQKRRAADLSLN